MPCQPGFFPVMIEDQATEEISGTEELIFFNIPLSISLPTFGIKPVSEKPLIISKGTPSSPTNTALPFFFTGAGPLG